MALFKKVVERKIDDPWGRLTRLINYTTGDTKNLIKYCIKLSSNEGIENPKCFLEKVYGTPHKILVLCKREVKQWPQIKFQGARAFRKIHNFLLECRKVLAS